MSKPATICLSWFSVQLLRSVFIGIFFRGHDLRRTYARRLYENDVPIEIIQKILGHVRIETTMKYIGIGENEVIKAITTGDVYIEKKIEVSE